MFSALAPAERKAPDSDIDFLVDFKPGASLFDHVHMRDELSQMFGTEVDVVSSKGLDPLVAPLVAPYVIRDAQEI